MKRTDSNLALNLATILAIAALFVLLLISATRADSNNGLYPDNSGAGDFQRYCAACHGLDGEGNGPVAPILLRRPTDLTLLASRNDGDFPDDTVFWIIDGRGEVKAHGPREMPVWGFEFSRAATGLELTPEAEARIRRIVNYVKSIQRVRD